MAGEYETIEAAAGGPFVPTDGQVGYLNHDQSIRLTVLSWALAARTCNGTKAMQYDSTVTEILSAAKKFEEYVRNGS